MRKAFILFLALLVPAGFVYAVGPGVGARSVAMGGTGIAIANDITAAYYNPACLMSGPENFEGMATVGAAMNGLNAFMDTVSEGDKSIEKFFSDDMTFQMALNGGLGFSFRKVGLSAFALGNANFNKPADSFNVDMNASAIGYVPLTLGSTFSTPGLPIASLSVGVNLKAIMEAASVMKVTQHASLLSGEGTSAMMMGSGFGFYIGAQAKITPFISVGAVIRNLSASSNRTITTKNIVVTTEGEILEGEDESEVKKSETIAPEIGIGTGVVIPITGTLIAVDMENYSAPEKGNVNKSQSFTDMHVGIEQGFFLNLVMLRMGYCGYGAGDNGDGDAYWTYGMGFNLGPANLGIAAANSVKDSNSSIAQYQLGAAF